MATSLLFVAWCAAAQAAPVKRTGYITMSDGVKSHPEVVEAFRDVSIAARTIQRDQVPEDVVGAVVFLCTPAADFITGQTMVIDGGQYFH